MTRLMMTLAGVLMVTLFATPTLGAGWAWDIGNGIGFVAFAGLLYLSASSGPGTDLRAHQTLGFAVLGVATAHAFWLLFMDPVVIEYIKPGAPVYMWMGVLGFVLLAALIFLGLPKYRRRLHKRHASFRYWHRGLATAAIAGAAYHIVGSGFYLDAAWQVALFLMLTVALLWLGRKGFRGDALASRAGATYLAFGAIGASLFAAIRNFSS